MIGKKYKASALSPKSLPSFQPILKSPRPVPASLQGDAQVDGDCRAAGKAEQEQAHPGHHSNRYIQTILAWAPFFLFSIVIHFPQRIASIPLHLNAITLPKVVIDCNYLSLARRPYSYPELLVAGSTGTQTAAEMRFGLLS